jgi:hypothetical protein
MTRFMRDKAIESIKEYGFVDPLTVYAPEGYLLGHYVIIDGEHRYDIGIDEFTMTEFPCVVVEGISDQEAKKLTVVLNELHGQADPIKLGDLLTDLVTDNGIEDLLVALPFTKDVVASFLDLPDLPDMPQENKEHHSAWVERLYRFPPDVVQVIDGAISKAQAESEINDSETIESWQALERICADFLAS